MPKTRIDIHFIYIIPDTKYYCSNIIHTNSEILKKIVFQLNQSPSNLGFNPKFQHRYLGVEKGLKMEANGRTDVQSHMHPSISEIMYKKQII